jgi:hypothetical protein
MLTKQRQLLQQPVYLFPPKESALQPEQQQQQQQEQMWRRLRRRECFLPILSAQLESELLIQSGRLQVEVDGTPVEREFPPCCFASKCIGQQQLRGIPGLTQAVTWTRAMTRSQWTRLLVSGEPPQDGSAWPCVLCHRDLISRYVHMARLVAVNVSAEMTPAAASPQPGEGIVAEHPEEICQFWGNAVDCPGGYRSECVLQPRSLEVVVEPLCEFFNPGLKAYQTESGAWQVEQTTTLFWQNDMVPDPPPSAVPDDGRSLPEMLVTAAATRMQDCKE